MAMAYVKMFVDWADIISPLDDAERGRLFTAILYYARTGFDPELTGNERFLFPTFKAQITRDSASYEEISRTRSEQGRKGGYAKAAKRQSPAARPGKTAQEKEKEKEEEEEKEKEKEKLSQSGPPRAALREQKDEERAARPPEPADEDVVTDPARIQGFIEEVRRELMGGAPGRGPAYPW